MKIALAAIIIAQSSVYRFPQIAPRSPLPDIAILVLPSPRPRSWFSYAAMLRVYKHYDLQYEGGAAPRSSFSRCHTTSCYVM